jgi:hypothetical protein
MKYIYLASPYTHDDKRVVEDRVHQVCVVAAKLMNRGIPIFSPIAHTHPIAMAGALPTGWEFWKKYDKVMIGGAEQLWVLQLDGWDISVGVKAEIDIATELGLTIQYGQTANEFLW